MRGNLDSGPINGRYAVGPEAEMQRGGWQSRGHGPWAQRDYGWDYQGGAGRGESNPRGLSRYSQDYDVRDRGMSSGGRGYGMDYDRGFRGGMCGGGQTGGYGLTWRYDEGYRATGRPVIGSGGSPRAAGGGYGGDEAGRERGGFRGPLAPAFGGQHDVGPGGGYGAGSRVEYDRGYRGQAMNRGETMNRGGGTMNRGGQQVTYGFGERQRGGYGRDFGGREFGYGAGLGGRDAGYDRGYTARPLTDDEFFSRVTRW